jgi:hypothetical protein
MRRFARSAIAQLALRASQASQAAPLALRAAPAAAAAAAALHRPGAPWPPATALLHTTSPALGSSSEEEEEDVESYAYDSIIYPQSTAAVGQPAPEFSAPGERVARPPVPCSLRLAGVGCGRARRGIAGCRTSRDGLWRWGQVATRCPGQQQQQHESQPGVARAALRAPAAMCVPLIRQTPRAAIFVAACRSS